MIEIGVDIGGTFTDVVLLRDQSSLAHTKVPSTPQDLVSGVRRGIEKILASTDASPSEVARLVHGSTVATNAFLERKGSLTGVLMTKGFEDTLEIGRTQRSKMYDLILEPVAPGFLARRRHRFGITERMAADGSVVTSLDEAEVRVAARALVDAGVEAVAVCYLFSFLNPEHELRTREILHDEAPGLRVSLSCEIDPQFREYERVLVTTLDAYLRAAVESYVGRLGGMLTNVGIPAPLQIMQSRGGIQNAAAAVGRPVSMLLSGLAAGVIGGKFSAQRAGFPNVITLDIGGTSCDVALVEEGKPLIASRGSIGGYPVRLQLVDVSTIGAGGGSIAWIDEAGGLRVGPQSAGAEPGPACYGRGGVDATVTDASIVLGYVNPDRFAGGELTLDADAATAAIERIAKSLGISTTAAAAGIHTILNARMADEIRLVSVQRGYDPRDFGLVALGGGGPVHGGALTLELGLARMIVPEAPGVLSAFGLLVSDIEFEQVATLSGRAGRIDEEQIAWALAELNRQGVEQMKVDGAPLDEVAVRQIAEVRYAGQSYELAVPIEADGKNELMPAMAAAFHDLHERVYGHCDRSASIEVVAVRTVHSLPVAEPRLQAPGGSGSVEDAKVDERPAYFEAAGGYVSTPRYERAHLPVGAEIDGPAVLEQADTTVVIHPGQRARVDASGAVVVERERG
jgi:N-methylhydantoinase A